MQQRRRKGFRGAECGDKLAAMVRAAAPAISRKHMLFELQALESIIQQGSPHLDVRVVRQVQVPAGPSLTGGEIKKEGEARYSRFSGPSAT